MVDDSVCARPYHRRITFDICTVVSDYSIFIHSILRESGMCA